MADTPTGWAHICVDMQRLFAEETPWHTPWMRRILPHVAALVAARPAQTIFTRFVPVRRPDDAGGAWRHFYERWESVTLDRLGPGLVDLMPELQRYAPPAAIVDKMVYSPWLAPLLHDMLRQRAVGTLVISGGETDVCVLATVLGAIDLGYRVVIAKDALCSSRDETHDTLLELFETRFSEQIEAFATEDILNAWPNAAT